MLTEFALVAVLLFMVIFAGIEFERMLLVYTAVANSARAGARYAIVHGSSRSTGSGADGQSGPGDDPTNVVNVVKAYAGASLLDVNRLTIRVRYLDASNDPGFRVRIAVSYPYDPFTWATFTILAVNLSSESRGIIEF